MHIIHVNMKIESVRFEPVNPVCEVAMLTTGLARQSQQMYNNMLHLSSYRVLCSSFKTKKRAAPSNKY